MNNLILISETELRSVISETIKTELAHLKPIEQTKNELLITRQEAANILGISLPTLGTYTNEGKIQSYRIGTRIRYKKDEVLNSLTKIQSLKFK